MNAPLNIIEGAYLSDILLQPSSLRACAEGLKRAVVPSAVSTGFTDGRLDRVVLTGMGSSLHALYPLHLTLADRGLATTWVETAELLTGFRSAFGERSLLVAVSQSGESAEVVGLLKHKARLGHVIGVTNDPGSTLGRVADTVLPLNAGREATVSCKTYVATLAVLEWLGLTLTGADRTNFDADLKLAGDAMSGYLANWRDHVAQIEETVRGIDSVFVTGRGPSLATAGTGGLILKESTGRPAEGMSCAAFRHGPLEMAGGRTLVVILRGDDDVAAMNRKLHADVNAGGGRAVLVSDGDEAGNPRSPFRIPAVPRAFRALVEILPVQMLSLAIAARDGREAGRFTRASKITTTA